MATTGQVFGVSGQSNSTTTNSAGVAGVENATSGAVSGVPGNAYSNSNGAAGVNGFEGGTMGQVCGVTGATNSVGAGAAGVRGVELATTGQVSRVIGIAASPNGTGVQAENSVIGGVVDVAGPSPFLLSALVGTFGAFTVNNAGNGLLAATSSLVAKSPKAADHLRSTTPSLLRRNIFLTHSSNPPT